MSTIDRKTPLQARRNTNLPPIGVETPAKAKKAGPLAHAEPAQRTPAGLQISRKALQRLGANVETNNPATTGVTKSANAGLGVLGRLKRSIGKTSVVAMIGFAAILPGLVQAQGPAPAPANAITMQAAAMNPTAQLNLDGLKAKDVDFRTTDGRNLNQGEVTFVIKEGRAPGLADALQNADEVVLLAPWGNSDGVGAPVQIDVDGKHLSLTAEAFGSALTQTDAAPVFLVKGSDQVQSFSVDFKKMDVNFNSLYHPQAEAGLRSGVEFQTKLVEDYLRFQRGEEPQHFDFGQDPANWEQAIEDGQSRIQQDRSNLQRDWVDTARRN